MKVQGTFAGKVEQDAKLIQSEGKKSFVSFTVGSTTHFANGKSFTDKVSCQYYPGDKSSVTMGDIKAGTVVFVTGDVSADSYVSKTSQKTISTIRMFVRGIDIIASNATKETASDTSNTVAQNAQPVADDDIPF
jgi:hypothetical protein